MKFLPAAVVLVATLRCANLIASNLFGPALDLRSCIDSWTMMFNWSDQDQVGGTLWPDITESEDHIVPHPMDAEEDTLFPAGDYIMNKNDEDVITNMRSNEEATLAKNDHLGYKSEGSSFHTNEELHSRIEIDSWLDFPNLCIDLKDEYTDGNTDTSVTELMNDLSDATNLNSVRGDSVQLNHEPDLFGHEDKENDDFLDCGWATFGDFDDIEKIFRKNDSIFGHDMIGDGDGFLSPSTDVIDSTIKSIPMPDLPLCKDQTSDEGCSSIQLDDHPDKQRSLVQKEKVNGQKIIPRSQNKAEERKNRPSRNFKDNYNQNQHMASTNVHASVATPLQAFQPKAINHQMQFGDAKLMEHHGSSNQVVFTPHRYPTYCFPGMQFPPNVQINRNQKRPVPASHGVCSDDTKHQKTSNRLLDAKQATMSPQAKMEKLRRLQQMQAQLAIEKQHQQYSTTGVHVSVPQSSSQNNQTLDAMTSTITIDECPHNVRSSELNMVAEQDESQMTSRLTYDPPAEETIYYQLQDVVGKLDMRTRFCIRDSLFRLARGAMDRQSASDRSSTNKSNKDEDEVSADEESRNSDRLTRLADSESDTNPIDRIVANLLFQRPTEACPRLGSYELRGST